MIGRSASVKELVIDSRLIVWAYHSDSQENLFGSFLPNEPTWQEMRAIGVGYWFTNTTQLRARVINIIIILVPSCKENVFILDGNRKILCPFHLSILF